MDYTCALQYSANVLSLVAKSKKFLKDLLEPGEDELQSLRMHVNDFATNRGHEVIVSQCGEYLMIAIQKNVVPEIEEEGVEGEGEAAEAAS